MNGLLLQHAGQGDAVILPAPESRVLENPFRDAERQKLLQQKLEAKAKDERDKKLEHLFKWNPEQGWYPHTKQVEGKVGKVFDFLTELKRRGGLPTPEEEDQLQRLKWDAEVTSKKSKDLQQLYPQLRGQIGQTDKYTDKAYLNSRLNDEIFGSGEKDVNQVNFDNLNNIVNDPKAFKVGEYTKDFAKSLPEMVDSQIANINAQGGTLLQDKEVKSKFFDLDQNGNIKIDPTTGNPKLKITPETVNLFMQEPRVQSYIQAERAKPENKFASDADIATKLLAPYATRQEKLSIKKGYSDKQAKGENATLTHLFDTENNYNLNGENGKGLKTSYSPHEIRIGGEKADKPIYINSKNLIDPNTNSYLPGEAGDKKVTVTRLRLVPFDKSNGKMLIGNKAETKNAANKMEWKWVADGMMQEKDSDGHATEKPVTMLYRDVENDLKEKMGVDLNSRDLGQITDHELVSIINQQYPNATPQEKVEILKKLRGQ